MVFYECPKQKIRNKRLIRLRLRLQLGTYRGFQNI